MLQLAKCEYEVSFLVPQFLRLVDNNSAKSEDKKQQKFEKKYFNELAIN